MSTFVLVPGAGGTSWYWHRVAPLLERAGHTAVAIDLPGDDETAGLAEYTRIVARAIDGRDDVVLVAQSLGGFTAAMVAADADLRALVFVNAMIPAPGETPGAWWANTGAVEARTAEAQRAGYPTEFDPFVYFLHDLTPDVIAAGEPHQRPEADAVFGSVCDFAAWPALPIRVVAAERDRFFPVGFQQAVARDRLGVEPDLLPGAHLVALSQPDALASYLLAPAR